MEQMEKPRSRKRKGLSKKARVTAGIGAAVLLCAAAAAGIYIQAGQKYKTVYFPNTSINGHDASGKTVEEVKQMIASGIDGYVLTLEEREGKREQIAGEDIGLQSVFDGSLERILADQNPNEWLKRRRQKDSYEIQTMIQYDRDSLDEKIKALECFDADFIMEPQNAYISDYIPGRGYTVEPAVLGNKVIEDKVKEGIYEAIVNLRESLSLEEIEAYEEPDVTEDDPALRARAEELNKYAGVTVTYTFGDSRETLTGERIAEWLSVGGDGQVLISEEGVAGYVKELASRYDTYNRAKTLKTSYGPTVRITGGIYGWRIDQGAEAGELTAVIRSGESQTREPVYRQRAASRGEADYGSTYVEINLTAQHLFYYKDGKLLAESDFVSGNLAKGHGTPAGTYSLTYKERNATLKGEDYRTPVDYWMPFNGGIGLHDATWRSSFGGEIYKTGGSHGCVNLPHSVAKKIFENISSGTPVLCYHLPGTESKSQQTAKPPENTKPSESAAGTAPAESTQGGGGAASSPAGQGTGEAQPSGPAESAQPSRSPEPETTKASEPGGSPEPEATKGSEPGGSPEPEATKGSEPGGSPEPETTKAPESGGSGGGKGPGVSGGTSPAGEAGPGVR